MESLAQSILQYFSFMIVSIQDKVRSRETLVQRSCWELAPLECMETSLEVQVRILLQRLDRDMSHGA